MYKPFTLPESSIAQYRSRPSPLTAQGQIVYLRTYCRTMADGRDETWADTVRRVVEGCFQLQQHHCDQTRTEWKPQKALATASFMYDAVYHGRFLPPGRGLWMMGTPYILERGTTAPLNNCGFKSTAIAHIRDYSGCFAWLMDMSMLGVGVGIDTEAARSRVEVRPMLLPKQSQLDNDIDPWTVPDTREGWVELVSDILDCCVGMSAMPTSIDFNEIREAGVPLKGFGGVSSGYMPLAELVQQLVLLYSGGRITGTVGRDRIMRFSYTYRGETAPAVITSALITDTANLIGKCVVSGNIRRSAEIVFAPTSDTSFMHLKDDKFALEHHRWVSNNTYTVTDHQEQDYTEIADMIANGGHGDPGLYWINTARSYGRLADPATAASDRDRPDHQGRYGVQGANPCMEQQLHDGELCNLVETFPARCSDAAEFHRTLKLAYLYAKSVTLLPTHNAQTNNIIAMNRRIGCSMSGIQQAVAKFGRRGFLRDFCDTGYRAVQHYDQVYSRWLGVPTSVRTTSIKPSGSISKLFDATAGIHHPPSRFYEQRIRFSEASPMVPQLEAAGYPVEPCIGQPGTVVVTLPMDSGCTRSEGDVPLWEQVDFAAQVQALWADNMVSITAKFHPHEKNDILPILETYGGARLKGISFLPQSLAHTNYVQAPWTPVTEEAYRALKSRINPDAPLSASVDTKIQGCDGDRCERPV